MNTKACQCNKFYNASGYCRCEENKNGINVQLIAVSTNLCMLYLTISVC